MTNEKDFKDFKIEFAPGCFDSFEGTQEELDELVAQIKEMFANGDAQAMAIPLDFDDLDEEDIEMIKRFDNQEGRTLQ
jgi:uncharacterized protein YqgV (UPF0045/DUF77 family)